MSCTNNNKNKERNDSVTGPLPEISVQQLYAKHQNGVSFYLLDVRSEGEFESGHLSFTDALIPYDQLDSRLGEIPQDKAALIYCLCRSGRRSKIATEYLRSVGLSNVFNVKGGIVAWSAAGYPIDNGKLRP
ncbi:MAG: rhodanese-like domain-containing protein [Candidatus Zixiibacteriota bacterium]